jgi:hypothetical protein
MIPEGAGMKGGAANCLTVRGCPGEFWDGLVALIYSHPMEDGSTFDHWINVENICYTLVGVTPPQSSENGSPKISYFIHA